MHWLGNEMTSDGNELLPTAMVLLGFGKHWNSEDVKRDEMRLMSAEKPGHSMEWIRQEMTCGAVRRTGVAW